MTKEIKNAESWVESLTKTNQELENFLVGTDDLTSYDLNVLYELGRRLQNRLDDKTSLLAKLKREEENV